MSVYKGGVDCPLVVKLYATVGLHRYNMLEVTLLYPSSIFISLVCRCNNSSFSFYCQGTNLHLHEIEKYVVVCTIMPVSYYITLIAEDPATSSFVTFQTHVDQRSLGQIDFTCYISRPKGLKFTALFFVSN